MKLKHKLTALLSAAAIFCAAAAPVSAADPEVVVEVYGAGVTWVQLEEMNYTVPVYVRLRNNPGLTSIEFGLEIDSRCTAKVVTGSSILSNLTYSQTDELIWFTWASGSVMEETGTLVRIDVTVPEDAVTGDAFAVNLLEEAYVSDQWNDNKSEIYYGEIGAVEYQNSYITVDDEPCDTRPSDSDTEKVTGDVNCDGKVSILDVILLNKALLAGEKITTQGKLNADVDGDGTPTSADSLTILKSTIGLAEL